jgi:hypothetical protein
VLTDSSFSVIATGFYDQSATGPRTSASIDNKIQKTTGHVYKMSTSTKNVVKAVTREHARNSKIHMIEDSCEKIYDNFDDEDLNDVVEAFNPNVKV